MTHPQRNADHRQDGTTTPDGSDPFPIYLWRRAVGCATELTDAERTVLRHIETSVDWKTGVTRGVSLDALAYEIGKDRDNIRKRYLPALIRKGWIVVAHASRGRGDATRYRLTFGDYRPFWNAGRDTIDDAEETGVMVTPVNPGSRGVMVTPKGGHGDPERGVAMPPPSSTSSNYSSLSVVDDVADVDATVGEREESALEETNPAAFIAAFPNRRARRGIARENAEAAYADAIATGMTHADIMRELSIDPPDRDTWPDAWLKTITTATTKSRREQTLNHARDVETRRRAACTRCAGDGLEDVTIPGGYHTVRRCTHPDVPRDPNVCTPCAARADDVHNCIPEAWGPCACQQACTCGQPQRRAS